MPVRLMDAVRDDLRLLTTRPPSLTFSNFAPKTGTGTGLQRTGAERVDVLIERFASAGTTSDLAYTSLRDVTPNRRDRI